MLDAELCIKVYGIHDLPEREGCHFLGTNRLHASIAWKVASDLEPERSASKRFKIVMSRVVEASHPYLGPPVKMWRVTSTGCAEVA